MNTRSPIPRSVAVCSYPSIAGSEELAEQIAARLKRSGIKATRGMLADPALREAVLNGDVDMLIALGGDGTMLRAGHLCGTQGVPVLGINLGHLGFLIEVERGGWAHALERVLSGDYWLESRMMLRVTWLRDDQVQGEWDVLNECAVSRGRSVRLVELVAEIDGTYLTTYAADAVILATPTGSTAYALAAGGPILPPELRNILIVPVAPHFSVDRAVVLHEGSTVCVTVRTGHEATLSMDGQPPIDLKDGDQVKVRAADHAVQFVRLQDPGYFYRDLQSRMRRTQSHGAAG
ncbi:MAG: NAD(+)/NADH kinase [Chloroflexi bacterium]|nr:NAD(+)/NADH kinase [Chloroflexota bacterium]